jgi:serine/threonine-protein kinase
VAQESDNPGPTLSEHPRTPRTSTRPKRSGPPGLDTTDSSGRRQGIRSHTPPSTTEMTARTALEASSLGRMRIMAVAMVGLTLVGMAVALMFEPSVSRTLALGSMTALCLGYMFVWFRSSRAEMDRAGMIMSGMIPICLAVVAANLAFGLLSPFGMAVALGMLMFGSSAPRLVANTAFAMLAGGYAVCALLVHLGVYDHVPLVPVILPKPWMLDAAYLLILILYGAAFAMGRMIRREQARGVANFERAVREASMREALLREARDALKNAAGIGAPGRFTDQELDGFKLGPVIGRGGMGEVYAAQRLADGCEAALKLLRMDALVERSALARFEREALIVASIQSPNVVQVLGVSNSDSVLPYIAMERLSGVDLASYLRDCGRISLLEVMDLVSQVAVGLSAAHAANVVHRDLKPNNLFRSGPHERPVWKILDFGVSKWMDSADATLTAAELVGTPQYMAPEQARGERDLDQCADVYALAAIAYRALTGEPPFSGRMPAILKCITDDMPRAPSSFLDLPRHVDYVLALGLAKQREQRFQSAFEFAAAFAMATGNNLSSNLSRRAKELLAVTPYAK